LNVRPLRIGTRGSPLALWQTNTVAALLRERHCTVELVVIKTAGDRLQENPHEPSTGKGVFVKEIEESLLSRAIDLAVHSAKDMSAVLPDGLSIGAVLAREDPRDTLVLRDAPVGLTLGSALGRIRARPTIGTSSVRRAAQLMAIIGGAHFAPIRGNVDTRLRKLDAGEFDAIDPSAAASFDAERALVTALGGGCQLPLGGIAIHEGADLAMQAVVTSADGSRVVKRSGKGSFARPAELGRRVADDLAKAGAIGILDEVR